MPPDHKLFDSTVPRALWGILVPWGFRFFSSAPVPPRGFQSSTKRRPPGWIAYILLIFLHNCVHSDIAGWHTILRIGGWHHSWKVHAMHPPHKRTLSGAQIRAALWPVGGSRGRIAQMESKQLMKRMGWMHWDNHALSTNYCPAHV